MNKSKISDVRYYSEETADVDHFTNENLGSCCSDMFVFFMCFILIGPIMMLIGLVWLISEVGHFFSSIASLVFQRIRETHENVGISLTFEEARWIDEINISMVGVLFMEKPMKLTELRTIICEKILNVEETTRVNENISRKFRQVARKTKCMWKWIEDCDFNVNNHVLSLNSNSLNLSDVLVDITNSAFNTSHPLWNLFLLDTPVSINQPDMKNFDKSDDGSQTPTSEKLLPNSTIILKIHPSITDGISLYKILVELLNDKSEPSRLKSSYQRKNIFFKLSSAIYYGIFLFFKLWCLKKPRQNIFESNFIENESIQPSDNMKHQFLFCHFSLEEITRLKLITRSTFGEIALSLLSSGIKYHHHTLSKTVNIKDYPCLITIDMSSNCHKINEIHKIRNDLSFFNIQLPLATEGIIPILWELKNRMKVFKSSSDYIFLFWLPKLLSMIFSTKFANNLMKYYYRKSRIMLSSFTSVGNSVTIRENKTKDILFWFPLFELISISMVCFSYNDKFTICLRGTNSKFVNLQLLLNAIKYQVKHLVKLLENRRIPGDKSDITFPNDYKDYPNTNLSLSKLSEDQILNMLNDIQIKIQNQSNYTAKEIEEMKFNFSILFAALKSKKKTADKVVQFDEDMDDPKFALNRRFSLPSKTKIVSKDAMKRLSVSIHNLNLKGKEIPEDEETKS